MKSLITALLALCFVATASGAAEAKRSAPDVQSSPIFAAQAPINPDPFNRARVGEATPAPTPIAQPAPAPAPIVVNAPPPAVDVKGWTDTGLLGVLGGLLIKIGFFPKRGSAGVTEPDTKPVSGLSLLNDPALRSTIEGAALKLVEGGAPGEAIKVALSLIPGAGPVVSLLEPAFRSISIKFLQDRVGATVPAMPATPADAPAVANVLDVLAKLIAQHKPAA